MKYHQDNNYLNPQQSCRASTLLTYDFLFNRGGKGLQVFDIYLQLTPSTIFFFFTPLESFLPHICVPDRNFGVRDVAKVKLVRWVSILTTIDWRRVNGLSLCMNRGKNVSTFLDYCLLGAEFQGGFCFLILVLPWENARSVTSRRGRNVSRLDL